MMYRKLNVLLIFLMIISITGCASRHIYSGDKEPLETKTITDLTKREVTIPANPKRIVTLSASSLNILYSVGGRAVGRVKTSSLIPKESKELEVIGTASKPNLKDIIDLKPDLVIGSTHDYTLVRDLEVLGIPVVFIPSNTYEETISAIQLMGEITNNMAQSTKIVDKIRTNTRTILSKVPSTHPKVLIIMGSSKRYFIALPSSLIGDLVSIAGGQNSALYDTPVEEGSHYAAFDLEDIQKWNPDVILTLNNGEESITEEKLDADFINSEDWKGLKAVEQGRVYSLPYDLFAISPGERLDEAIKELVTYLYPEV